MFTPIVAIKLYAWVFQKRFGVRLEEFFEVSNVMSNKVTALLKPALPILKQ
ncbi:hypothetical protein D3C84_1099590 [compost metagenome]